MDLNDAQIERYSRQIILPEIGGRGQQRLLETTVRIIGDGPLPASAACYLVAAGIGTVDLWATAATAVDGLRSLRLDLRGLNPDATVRLGSVEDDGMGAPSADRPATFVCADVTAAVLEHINFRALQDGVPLLVGIAGMSPRLARYAGHDITHPCTACDPEAPVRSPEGGVPDPMSGLIGSLLALDAIKWSLGTPDPQPGTALHYDPETLTITEWRIAKRVRCRACGASEP